MPLDFHISAFSTMSMYSKWLKLIATGMSWAGTVHQAVPALSPHPLDNCRQGDQLSAQDHPPRTEGLVPLLKPGESWVNQDGR